MTTKEYLDKIPYHFRQQPNFINTLRILIENNQDIYNMSINIIDKVKIDTTNTSILDMLGQWLNVSRFISPALLTATFSWNIVKLGWNQANWGSGKDDKSHQILNNLLYSYLVRFKQKWFNFDGTNCDLEAILNDVFKNEASFEVVDNMNMTVDIKCYFKEKCPFELTQLILNGSLPIQITGVKLVWRDMTVVDDTKEVEVL